ncbi:threonine/serine exporter family protein, partial [Kitasatospora sp. NPDC057512]|uniref:threonine/serine exporter family protein n=1 Tax=Kitasatospora sp. NPDC057512 TaxID=3346154 RepID=UPI0036B38FD6
MPSKSPSVRDADAPPDPLCRLLLDLGEALLGGGLPVHEVEDELRGLGRALGAPEVQVAALTNGLFVALDPDGATRFQPLGGTLRFEQTADVLHLVHRLRAGGLDGPRARAELDRIRRAPARWPAWVADFGALPVGVGVC